MSGTCDPHRPRANPFAGARRGSGKHHLLLVRNGPGPAENERSPRLLRLAGLLPSSSCDWTLDCYTGCSTSAFGRATVATARHRTASGASAVQRDADRPSFLCTRSMSAVERMICRDPELARLDRIMSELSTQTSGLLLNTQKRAEAIARQRAWLMTRDRCGNVQCLRQQYFRRIHDLAGELPIES